MADYQYKTGYISGYGNHTWARVPFYWTSSPFYQAIYRTGDGAPFWIIYTVLSVAAVSTFATFIQFSLWWIYPTVLTPLLWVFAVLQALWIAGKPLNGSNRAIALDILTYKSLPRKIRRELKKSAKQMNDSTMDETDLPRRRWEEASDWQKIVSGYAEMHPVTERPKADPLANAKAKFDERLTLIEEERKVLEHQQAIEAEIQAEVRDRVKKQMEAEGKVYVELNV